MNRKDKCKGLNKNWKLVNFCEFDKYAVKSYCAIHNVDEKLNLGDITKVNENELQSFNMICGGSPCQDFSIAGKLKGSVWICKNCKHKYNPLTVHWSKRGKCPICQSENIDKSRSSLLVEWLRIIQANKPNFGIYENVKNIVGKQFKDTTFKVFEEELHEYGYNTYWKVLNAKNYGIPQNRERVYLLLIKKELDNGTFKFPEGFDSGVRLKDMLEEEVDERFYLSDDKVKEFLNKLFLKYDEQTFTNNQNESKQLGYINNYNGDANRVYSDNLARTLKSEAGGEGAKTGWYLTSNSIILVGKLNSSQDGVVVDPRGISRTHTAGHNNTPKIICGIDKSINEPKSIERANYLTERGDRGDSNRKSEGTVVLEKIGNINPSGKGMNGNVFTEDGLSPTLTTNKGEGNKILIKQATKQGYIECDIGGVADLSYPTSKTRRGRVQDNGHTSPTITATETGIHKIESEVRIRKLTPKECFRLMGFLDKHYQLTKDSGISNTQLYKQTGNSIVVDVLYYILVELYKSMPYLFDDLRLSSFFSGIGAFEIALNKLYESIKSGNFTRPQLD